ncbi:reverse transcriptase domain-containing protein [Tanacetum coccineum]|uniref:Reverse transcriptase domain-containing protein n=1 Tax=Tanacetum coccineum TaxID=301880 RepID=A0ABQ5CA54_9ASTR
MKKEMRMISKDGTISEFLGYTSSKEEKEEEEEEEEEEKEESKKKGLKEAFEIGSNSESSGYAASDNEVESDLESTARSEPKCKEMEDTCESGIRPKLDSSKAVPAYMLPDYPSQYDKIMRLEILFISSNVYKFYLFIEMAPNRRVTNNVNNANANGGNNGCSYKGFLACNPQDYDRKGGAIALTRWIEKMESVEFKALLVEEFCPSNEMEKLESEFWNHTMVGANHAGYTDWFHELAKLVPHLVTPKSKRIGRYINGLAPQIRGMLRATQPTTIQSAILKAGILTDKAVRCGTLTRSSEKRKEAEETRNRLALEGNQNTQNNGNQAKGSAFNVNAVDALQDPNVVMGTFSLNDHFAIVLFDSRADFSFISTKFAPLLNVKPSIVSPRYVIEVANGKKEEVDRIIRDCKLELENSLFTIDLTLFGHSDSSNLGGYQNGIGPVLRFGGNDESKKKQKSTLEANSFEGFRYPTQMGLTLGYERFQKYFCQLRDSWRGLTVDVESVDWNKSISEDDDNYAFMANNNSGSDTQVPSCSNECKESYANIKRLYDTQREQLSDASVEIKVILRVLRKLKPLFVVLQQINFDNSGNLSYENEVFQSVFRCNASDSENPPLHKRLAKTCEMQAVPPPMTGNYFPLDLMDKEGFTAMPETTQTKWSCEEKRNMYLIEAVRTIACDSFLPNTFWVKLLVLLALFLTGKDLNWLFDLDYLTDSMNYLSVSSENQANIHAGQQESNQNAGTKDKIVAGDSEKEDESAQDCFEVPFWHSYSSTNTSSSKSDKQRRIMLAQTAKDSGTTLLIPLDIQLILPLQMSWGELLQEELLQFEIQKVWILVDLPYGKKAIGTKWVYRNKKDERGVVVRNKARLVAQEHRQEEGIDYDEVFALCLSLWLIVDELCGLNHQVSKILSLLRKSTKWLKLCMDYIKLQELGTDISQKVEKPSKKRQNRARDGKVCEDEAQSKSSHLREEKAKKNIT